MCAKSAHVAGKHWRAPAVFVLKVSRQVFGSVFQVVPTLSAREPECIATVIRPVLVLLCFLGGLL